MIQKREQRGRKKTVFSVGANSKKNSSVGRKAMLQFLEPIYNTFPADRVEWVAGILLNRGHSIPRRWELLSQGESSHTTASRII
jgi:hypothetical protein